MYFVEMAKLFFGLMRASQLTPNGTSVRSPASLPMSFARTVLFSFFTLRTMRFLFGLFLLTSAPGISMAQAKPEEVVYPSSGQELHGFLWKPEGTGPFPAVLWNHGSEKFAGSQPNLAKFYTARLLRSASPRTRPLAR